MNIDNISWKGNADVFFEDLDKMYFTLWEINLIGCYDLKDGSISFIFGPLDESLMEVRLYSGISRWKDYLVFTPCNAKNIWKYNLIDSTWVKLDISDFLPSVMTNKFATGFVDRDKLYMFGYNYSNIMIVNLLTDEISVISPLSKNNGPKQINFFVGNYVRRNQFVYIMNFNSNYLYKFDLDNLSGEWIHVGETHNNYAGVLFHNDKFWFVPHSNSSAALVIGDERGDEREVYELRFSKKEYFYGCYIMQSDITFYNYTSQSVTYNLKNHSCKYNDFGVSTAYQLRDHSWIICEIGGKLKRFYEDGKFISESYILIDQEKMRRYVKENMESIKKCMNEKIMQENKSYGIELLLCLM